LNEVSQFPHHVSNWNFAVAVTPHLPFQLLGERNTASKQP